MPVTWQECKLVEMEKNFPVPTVNCSKVNSIPYCDYKQVDSTAMKNKLTCEVSSVSVKGLPCRFLSIFYIEQHSFPGRFSHCIYKMKLCIYR